MRGQAPGEIVKRGKQKSSDPSKEGIDPSAPVLDHNAPLGSAGGALPSLPPSGIGKCSAAPKFGAHRLYGRPHRRPRYRRSTLISRSSGPERSDTRSFGSDLTAYRWVTGPGVRSDITDPRANEAFTRSSKCCARPISNGPGPDKTHPKSRCATDRCRTATLPVGTHRPASGHIVTRSHIDPGANISADHKLPRAAESNPASSGTERALA